MVRKEKTNHLKRWGWALALLLEFSVTVGSVLVTEKIIAPVVAEDVTPPAPEIVEEIATPQIGIVPVTPANNPPPIFGSITFQPGAGVPGANLIQPETPPYDLVREWNFPHDFPHVDQTGLPTLYEAAGITGTVGGTPSFFSNPPLSGGSGGGGGGDGSRTGNPSLDSSPLASTSVPEPAFVGLIGLATLGILSRRTRTA